MWSKEEVAILMKNIEDYVKVRRRRGFYFIDGKVRGRSQLCVSRIIKAHINCSP